MIHAKTPLGGAGARRIFWGQGLIEIGKFPRQNCEISHSPRESLLAISPIVEQRRRIRNLLVSGWLWNELGIDGLRR
jgi:hypothetical protein